MLLPRQTSPATFTEDMMASSITDKTFKLSKKGSTTKLPATVSYPDPNPHSPPLYGETRPERSPTERGHLQGGSYHRG